MRSVMAGLVVLALCGGVAVAEETRRVMTMTGTGTVTVQPDLATIRIGVEQRLSTATEAVEETSRATVRILQTLRAAGVEARDIQTSNFAVQPIYSDRRNEGGRFGVIIAYRAINQVSATIRDLTTLGGLLDTVVGDGANRINGISFGVSDRSAALQEARVAAVADARLKAETYASAAGVSLGAILNIDEQGGAGQRPVFAEMRAMAADAQVPVAAGSSEIKVTVAIRWSLD